MRLLLQACALALALSAAGQATDPAALSSYAERRRALAADHADGVIVLFGYRDGEGQSGSEAFRQENNFYYLSGVDEPGAALLLEPGGGDTPYRETLFLPAPGPHEADWSGPRPDPGSRDAAELYGFLESRRSDDLSRFVGRAAKDAGAVYTIIPPAQPLERRRLIPDRSADLAAWADVQLDDILPAVERMRLVKSTVELRLIEKAVEASVDAHLSGWERLEPGLFEYQAVAAMTAALIDLGCQRMAYPPIVGSGPNSVILHYQANGRAMQAGELLLSDVGGEYAHYAADITRTIPVGGRFTARQREVYDIVLEVQHAVIEAVRPGMRLDGDGSRSLTALARRLFRKAGRGLDSRFLHAVGHHVGLDVHDPSGGGVALEPGMVITVEPGLYLPDEGFGVRIEDVLVVTEDGARVLSERLPKDPDEIERRLEAFASARQATRRP